MKFEHLPKIDRVGSVRSIAPEVTIKNASRFFSQVGITAVSDITDLDRIGIPNFMSVRPLDQGPGISYYNGKGIRKIDAHAGAIMEAIERHAGERWSHDVILGSYSELSQKYTCVNPYDLSMPFLIQYSHDLILEWVDGLNLATKERVLVPLNCVQCPYEPKNGGTKLFHASTNGLASGNNLTEAVVHAIFEVIERYAYALAAAEAELGPIMQSLLGKLPKLPKRKYKQVLIDGLPTSAKRLLSKIKRAGLQPYIRDFSAYAPIAVIDCALVDSVSSSSNAAYGGLGAHLDAEVALLRAITEAAQSRLGMIQGGREDLGHIVKTEKPSKLDEFYRSGAHTSFSDIKSKFNKFIDDDLYQVLEKMPAFGLSDVIVIDMTHPEVRIPVVRVVVPSAETWTVYRLHTGTSAFGKRAYEILNEQVNA